MNAIQEFFNVARGIIEALGKANNVLFQPIVNLEGLSETNQIILTSVLASNPALTPFLVVSPIMIISASGLVLAMASSFIIFVWDLLPIV